MEDQKIGERCQICKTRDYAPYFCKYCNKYLCSQHYWEKDHKCRLEYAPPKPKQQNNKQQYFCAFCKAKLFTVNHYYCNQCNKLYCLKHRHKQQHNCKGQDGCILI